MDGTLPDGFVADINPANGAVDVSMDITTITIYYNQPMKNNGQAGSVERPEHYLVRDQTMNLPVAIVSRTYDPLTYTLTLDLYQQLPIWQPSNLYKVTIKGSVQNACGSKQSADVTTTFTTGLSTTSNGKKWKKASPSHTLTPAVTPTLTSPVPWSATKTATLPPTLSMRAPTLAAVPTRTPRWKLVPNHLGPKPITAHVNTVDWLPRLLKWLGLAQARLD